MSNVTELEYIGGGIKSSSGLHIGYGVSIPVSAVPPVTYATWNPADKGNITLSNGNLTAQANAGVWEGVRSTISKSSGKWYTEYTCTSGLAGGGVAFGISNSSAPLSGPISGDTANGWGLFGGGPNKMHNAVYTLYGNAHGNLVQGDIIQILLDMDNGTIEFGINGTLYGTAFTGISGNIFILQNVYNNGNVVTANFGATPFAYSVPAGYNAGLYDTVDLSAGLVAEYILATNSLDTSGNGYNGTDWGTTSYASNSLVLNGAGAILIDDNVPVRLLGNYTYSVWANTSVNSGAHRFVNKDKAIDFSGGYSLFIIDGQYYIQHVGGSFESCGYTGVSAKPNSEWHNFMVIFNGTSVKYYIDNVEVYSTATTQTLGFQADAKLMLGSYGSSAPTGQLFQGNMKKARFYDRALNAVERAALYAEG